jgi:4-carboxymuconolactone decarboxylase
MNSNVRTATPVDGMDPGLRSSPVNVDFEAGARLLAQLSPDGVAAPWVSFADIAPALGDSVALAFGRIVGRPGLDLRTRELVTVAILAALGGCEAQVTFHAGAALRAGATASEIVEALTQLSVYAGIPRALNAVAALRPAFGAVGADALAESPRSVAADFLRALLAGDKAAAAALLHPDLVWLSSAGDHPFDVVWSGPAGSDRFVQQLHANLVSQAGQPDEPLALGDLAYVPLRHRCPADSTPRDSVLRLRIDAGRIRRAEVFTAGL